MKCPCEECISLAICNNTIKDMPEPKVRTLAIVRQCHDLFCYLNYEDHMKTPGKLIYYSETEIRINIARQLYGLVGRGNYEK